MSNIYVVASEGGMCKIGMAKNPARRMRTLMSGHPHKLSLVGSFPVDPLRAHRLEREAHAKLADRRMQGEWFAISPNEAMAVVGEIVIVKAQSDATDFERDIAAIGWDYRRLAKYIGVTTETLRVWREYGPPKVAALAVKALASGWRPEWKRDASVKALASGWRP